MAPRGTLVQAQASTGIAVEVGANWIEGVMQTTNLQNELDRCKAWIDDALLYSGGTHDFTDVCKSVLANHSQLWSAENSAVITQIYDLPKVKSLHYFLAGGEMSELKALRPRIEDWAKSIGCTRITLTGRKGWEKTFLRDEGYEAKWAVLVKEL